VEQRETGTQRKNQQLRGTRGGTKGREKKKIQRNHLGFWGVKLFPQDKKRFANDKKVGKRQGSKAIKGEKERLWGF